MRASARRALRGGSLLLALPLILAGCGGTQKGPHSATLKTLPSSARQAVVDQPEGSAPNPYGDWTRFDYDAQRSGVGPYDTGITAANAGQLQTRVVAIDGTADSSPIELHSVALRGKLRDVIAVTTSYGHTIAIDPAAGTQLWEYKPRGIDRLAGSSQITTATPVEDPDRRHIYVASPDGFIHKLAVADGREVKADGWPTRITLDPKNEKIGGALNITGEYVLAVVGGYIENTPSAEHYQGHAVLIDRRTGRIHSVFNTLCSNRHVLIVPKTCNANDAAVWARSGVVVEPGSGRLLIATGNGHFNGTTWWGDSVLELSPNGARLLHNWTPGNQAALDRNDFDIGSTAPALLPPTGGRRLAVQGGKDGVLRLLDLDRLDGTTSGAGRRTGGELQAISALGGGLIFTAPAVWVSGGHIYVFVADEDGIAAYTLLAGTTPQLAEIWSSPDRSTSPVLAGGLLYAFDLNNKTLDIRAPLTGKLIRSLPAAVGHWDSPIAIGGRVVLPVGDYQKHLTNGTIYIYHLPGR